MGKRTCWNGCKIFGYDFDQGAKSFTVAEFFLAIFNLRTTMLSGDIAGTLIKANSENSGATVSVVMEGVALIVFFVSLLVQTAMGFFLHFYGWKKRNVTICWIWFVSAIINVFYPTFIYLIWYNRWISVHVYTICEYYLLYNIYGCWIIFNFVKWAESKGIATELRIGVSNEPDDDVESPHEDTHSISRSQSSKRKTNSPATTPTTAKVTPIAGPSKEVTVTPKPKQSTSSPTPGPKKDVKRKKTTAAVDGQKTDDYF